MQVISLATIAAPVIGGWIVVTGSWQGVFWVLAAFGAVALLTAWRMAPRGSAVSHPSRPSQRAAWAMLLRNRRFVLLTLSSGFAVAAMFSLMMGSSFVFVDQFGWPADRYGLLYAATSVAFIGVAWINDHALRSHSPSVLLAWALPAQLALCLGMAAGAAADAISPPLLGVLLALLFGNIAFIHGNLVAVVLEETRGTAGLGAGLLGVTQYGLSALTPLAAELTGGTPLLAMALSTTFCAALTLSFFLLGARTPALKPQNA
jgi:MFS transporter, DHA1 family, multidrug resistance protein